MSAPVLSAVAPPPAFALALERGIGPVEATGQTDWDKALAKELRPLGYELLQWRQAIGMLQARHRKSRLPADLSSFLDFWLPREPLPEPPAEFSLLLGQDEHGCLRLHAASLPFAAAPAWRALLHLPALRGAWAADLRASHLDHLLKIIPQAWLMDPTPMVPGTEIAGLGLPSWSHLVQLRESGRSFELHHGANSGQQIPLISRMTAEEWRADLDNALSSRVYLLTETPSFTKWWLALYGSPKDQLVLTNAFEASFSNGDWVIHKARD